MRKSKNDLYKQALKEAGLFTEDLSIIDEIVIKAGIKPKQILKDYHTPKEKVFCGLCKRRLHYEGAVVLFNDESITTVGWKCAENAFQESWAILIRDLEAREYAAFNKSYIMPAREAAEQGIKVCRGIYPAARMLDKFFKELRKEMPDLSNKLSEIARDKNGQWVRVRKQKRIIKNSQREITEIVEDVRCTIDGYKAIRGNLLKIVTHAYRLFEKSKGLLEMENLSQRQIIEARQALKTAEAELAEAKEVLAYSNRFMTLSNWKEIASAASQDLDLDGKYYANASRITLHLKGYGYKESFSVKIPYEISQAIPDTLNQAIA